MKDENVVEQPEHSQEESLEFLHMIKAQSELRAANVHYSLNRVLELQQRKSSKKWSHKKALKMFNRYALLEKQAAELENVLNQVNVRLDQHRKY